VTWKLYDLFGLLIGPDNFIDLDSSNDKKFSRHLIVIISDNARGDDHLSPHYDGNDSSSSVLPPIPGSEWLFRSNIEVGHFVDAIVNDVLLMSEELPDMVSVLANQINDAF
jgi:hypothetical protein